MSTKIIVQVKIIFLNNNFMQCNFNVNCWSVLTARYIFSRLYISWTTSKYIARVKLLRTIFYFFFILCRSVKRENALLRWDLCLRKNSNTSSSHLITRFFMVYKCVYISQTTVSQTLFNFIVICRRMYIAQLTLLYFLFSPSENNDVFH